MAESAEHLSRERAEMNISEITQELRSQLAESQQQFQDLKEKFPGPPTDYCLAKQLKKSTSTQAACPQGTWSGDLSHRLSEVQASQTAGANHPGAELSATTAFIKSSAVGIA
ncbi:putative NBPF family member NBPF5 [Callithrix jacchus]